MTILVIETATAACSAALLDGDRLLARGHEIVGRGHAERLVPMIGELLAQAGIARADAVLVDVGPGSFTGIRVGLAAARAFGFAWGAPVHGFSSLALIAVGRIGEEPLTVAIGGGHGELFLQRFAPDPFAPAGALASFTPDVAAAATPDRLVIGSGADALVAARGWGDAEARFPDASEARLLPMSLATLPPTPLYGRPPDAVPPR